MMLAHHVYARGMLRGHAAFWRHAQTMALATTIPEIRRPRPVFLKSEHLCLSLPFLVLLLHAFVLSLSCLVFVFVKIQIKSKS